MKNTGATFFLTPSAKSFEDAELACQTRGGHLATFTTQLEQQEVENFYTSNGYWFPTNFVFYWIGLRAINWPNFRWVDRMFPAPTAKSYRNWGSFVEPGKPAVGEPYYTPDTPPQMCGGGNFTESLGGVFGWADAMCTSQYMSMCRVQREWQSWLLLQPG